MQPIKPAWNEVDGTRRSKDHNAETHIQCVNHHVHDTQCETRIPYMRGGGVMHEDIMCYLHSPLREPPLFLLRSLMVLNRCMMLRDASLA